jgi:DnaJ family protein A protein 2
LRPANSEQQFSDKNRTTAKSINTSTSVCQACNGLGGREDKIRDCAWCKQIEDVRGVWSPASKVSIKRICKECKGQGTTIKEKYRCKVCNGTKKQPKRLPRDRETASRYSSPS